jgi:hypothetical protein
MGFYRLGVSGAYGYRLNFMNQDGEADIYREFSFRGYTESGVVEGDYNQGFFMIGWDADDDTYTLTYWRYPRAQIEAVQTGVIPYWTYDMSADEAADISWYDISYNHAAGEILLIGRKTAVPASPTLDNKFYFARHSIVDGSRTKARTPITISDVVGGDWWTWSFAQGDSGSVSRNVTWSANNRAYFGLRRTGGTVPPNYFSHVVKFDVTDGSCPTAWSHGDIYDPRPVLWVEARQDIEQVIIACESDDVADLRSLDAVEWSVNSTNGYQCLSVQREGTAFAVGNDDGEVEIRDTRNGALIASHQFPLDLHGDPVEILRIAICDDSFSQFFCPPNDEGGMVLAGGDTFAWLDKHADVIAEGGYFYTPYGIALTQKPFRPEDLDHLTGAEGRIQLYYCHPDAGITRRRYSADLSSHSESQPISNDDHAKSVCCQRAAEGTIYVAWVAEPEYGSSDTDEGGFFLSRSYDNGETFSVGEQFLSDTDYLAVEIALLPNGQLLAVLNDKTDWWAVKLSPVQNGQSWTVHGSPVALDTADLTYTDGTSAGRGCLRYGIDGNLYFWLTASDGDCWMMDSKDHGESWGQTRVFHPLRDVVFAEAELLANGSLIVLVNDSMDWLQWDAKPAAYGQWNTDQYPDQHLNLESETPGDGKAGIASGRGSLRRGVDGKLHFFYIDESGDIALLRSDNHGRSWSS